MPDNVKTCFVLRHAFVVASFTLLTSCGGLYTDYSTDNPDPIDRPSGLNRDVFTDEMFPKTKDRTTSLKQKTPPVPRMSDVLLAPPKPKLGINKTVSLSVTEEVDLKDVLIELARLADIDIEIDPQIRGGIIFKATNKPFDEVVERITNLANLRYSVNNGVLRIERDRPYIENYYVDFPNITRSNSGTVTVNTAVLSGGGGGGESGGSGGASAGGGGGGESGDSGSGGGISSGSSNSITSSYDGDLWASVEEDITAIIGTAAPAGGPGPGGVPDVTPFVSVNRQAGMITVATTQKNHNLIKQYLAKIGEYTSAQVLIEAKVIEVSLNDQFQSGIDWRAITDFGADININTGAPVSGNSIGDIATLDFTRDNGNIDVAVQLAQVFGATRTLSSPRLLVLNNQQAVLSFATNQVYFTLDVQTDTTSSAGTASGVTTTTVDSTLNTVPVGLILTLQPSINERTGEVLMNIRPTLSRLTGVRVEDPAVAFYAQNNNINVSNTIPEVEVREMDSLLRLKSGEIMAIGGMIEQRSTNTDRGIPYVADVPLLGNAFKSVSKNHTAVQTIIFLKATIVPSYGVDEYDQKFYNTFETDPRPVAF